MKTHIISYSPFRTHLELYLSNGSIKRIYFNENSGKVYFRYKIGDPSIKHPGVFIGIDESNEEYWIHNHYQFGAAHVTTGYGFKQGKTIYVYKEFCTNSWLTVIEKAMQHVMNKESYKPISYNCQTLVNDSCDNLRKSEDAERLVKGLVGTVVVAVVLGAIFGK